MLACKVSRPGARDQFWIRHLNFDFTPLAIARATAAGLISHGIKRSQVGSDFGIQAGHLIETIDFRESSASAVGNTLQARPRRRIDSRNIRPRYGQTFWIA